MWRERLSGGRGDWGLEQAWLLLAAMLPVRLRVQGPPGLAPAARGYRSQAGGTAHQAQALVQVQGPTPPCQLSPQALDLPPQSMVVLLQGLMLLQGEAEGQRGGQPAPGAHMRPVLRHPSPAPRVLNEGKDTTATKCASWGAGLPLASPPQPPPSPNPPPPRAQMCLLLSSIPPTVASPGLTTGTPPPQTTPFSWPEEPLDNCAINQTPEPSLCVVTPAHLLPSHIRPSSDTASS